MTTAHLVAPTVPRVAPTAILLRLQFPLLRLQSPLLCLHSSLLPKVRLGAGGETRVGGSVYYTAVAYTGMPAVFVATDQPNSLSISLSLSLSLHLSRYPYDRTAFMRECIQDRLRTRNNCRLAFVMRSRQSSDSQVVIRESDTHHQ